MLRNFIQTNYDATSAPPSPHRRRGPEAEVVAGCAIADHADVKRIKDAKHLFADAAGFRQLVADQGNQRRVFFHFHATQRGELGQQRLVSRVSPAEVEPVVSMVRATLTSEVVIKSTEMLWRARIPNTSARKPRSAAYSGCVASAASGGDAAPARGTAAGSRWFYTPAYRPL